MGSGLEETFVICVKTSFVTLLFGWGLVVLAWVVSCCFYCCRDLRAAGCRPYALCYWYSARLIRGIRGDGAGIFICKLNADMLHEYA